MQESFELLLQAWFLAPSLAIILFLVIWGLYAAFEKAWFIYVIRRPEPRSELYLYEKWGNGWHAYKKIADSTFIERLRAKKDYIPF